MPTRGLMLPTREIGPRLSEVKAGGLNRLRGRLCSRAVSNGRSEWVQACWQNNVQGIRAIAGSCYLHGHCLVGHAMAEIEQSAAGLVAVDAF